MGTVRKLLLADDSITIQKVVDLTFADEGFEVTTVGSGDLAVEKLEEIVPDIVLADVHMPGLNGYEVCELIKQDDRYRHIPVMLLVGSFEPFNEAEARRVGADDYLTKPFQSIRQLVSKVGSLLSGKSAEVESTGEVDVDADVSYTATNESDASSSPVVPVDATVEVEAAMAEETSEDAFADPRFDDAMIEATPADDFTMNRNVSASVRATTPLNETDLVDAGLKSSQATAIHTQDTLRMNAKEVWGEGGSASSAVVATPPLVARQASPDDALLDLGDDEPQLSSREEGEFILDIWDDAPAKKPSPSDELADSGVVMYEGEVSADRAPAAQVDEEDVIEIEPRVESAAVRDRGMSEPRTGQITLEQLSPDAIDAIARRAVTQLSEKVIEQIAWEVVPELAERIIKRRLEEERTQ